MFCKAKEKPSIVKKPLKTNLSESDKAWLAAMIDAEGSIFVSRGVYKDHNPTYGARITVNNSYKKIVDRCYELTGVGSIREMSARSNFNMHLWEITHNDAIAVISEVYPYLIQKREQAKVAIAIQKTNKQRGAPMGQYGGNSFMSQEELKEKDRLWQLSKDLNQRRIESSGLPEPDFSKYGGCESYFFETQYEPMAREYDDNFDNSAWKEKTAKHSYDHGKPFSQPPNALGRIKRCVWRISTKPFSGAHFAVFSPDLVLPMIKAGSPEYICNKCQKPRTIQYEEQRIPTRPGLETGNGKSGKHDDPNEMLHRSDLSKYRQQIIRTPRVDSRHFRADGTYYKIGGNKYTEAGLSSGNPNRPRTGNLIMTDCGCNAGFHSSVVIDPFMGSGTVGLVAAQNARDFIGIELNPEYIKIAKERLKHLLQQTRLNV